MKRLLSVNNYYYGRGGADIVFLRHNELFSSLNWEVIPFSMRHPRNLESDWAEYFIDEIEYGQKYNIFDRFIKVVNSVYSFDARKKLNALIQQRPPDLCHCHNIYHHISPSILSLLRRKGVPVVMTLHDLKLACPAYSMLAHDGVCERCRQNRIYNVISHRCMKDSLGLSFVVFVESLLHRILQSYTRYVNKFIVPSRFYLEKFAEWGFERSSFSHIPNFIDVHGFSPQYRPGRNFIYFGRLSKEKGLVTLFKAAASAGAPLVIAGSGPMEPSLREFASENRVDVKFLGYLSGFKLHDAIASARAFILPSEWYENSPLSILEAYALGKPVIGSRIGGIPELIAEGKTGFTFECGSVEALTDKMRKLSAMKDAEIAAMGQNGRDWVVSSFNEEVYYQRVAALYETLS